MKNSKVLKAILFFLGFILTALGSWRLFDPISFFENSALILSDDSGILNEARATGGVVVGFGLLILSGVFIPKLSFTSTIVAVVLFLSFGIARLVGFGLDGDPQEGMIQGMIFEFVFGTLALFALVKYRKD